MIINRAATMIIKRQLIHRIDDSKEVSELMMPIFAYTSALRQYFGEESRIEVTIFYENYTETC